MTKILNAIGYDSKLDYKNRILYTMLLLSILVAGFYLTLYLLYIPFLPAIIVHICYILFDIFLFGLLKYKKFTFVKVSMVIAHMVQLTLAVYLWFPIQTGYNLYYIMVPMVAFIVIDYGNKFERYFALSSSIISAFLYYLSVVIDLDNYFYNIEPGMNRFLSGIGILSILIPMTYIFYWFAKDSYRIHKELHILANTDDLTRTRNRRVLYEDGNKAFARAQKYHKGFTLIVFDIDYFKKVNDKYGHPVGDDILKQIATLISINIRKDDHLFRYGGEEFAVIVKNTDERSGMKIASDIHQLIRKQTFNVNDIEIPITISVGAVVYSSKISDFNHMIALADKALYQAKNNGRDRVIYG